MKQLKSGGVVPTAFCNYEEIQIGFDLFSCRGRKTPQKGFCDEEDYNYSYPDHDIDPGDPGVSGFCTPEGLEKCGT